MRYLAEWLKVLGLDFDTVLGGWRYTVYSCGAVTVDGHKGLLSVTPESILMRVGGGMLEVTGQNLHVEKLADGILAIQGQGIAVHTMGQTK